MVEVEMDLGLLMVMNLDWIYFVVFNFFLTYRGCIDTGGLCARKGEW